MSYTGLFITVLLALLARDGFQILLGYVMMRVEQKQAAENEEKLVKEMQETGKVPPELMGAGLSGFPMLFPLAQPAVPTSGTEEIQTESHGQYL